MIFFNVEPVREFLIINGYVYTLRKKRFRIGNDIAVYGSYYKHKIIAKVFIETVPIGQVTNSEILAVYFDYSGLKGSASEWFELAKKLSGDELYLYKVSVRNEDESKSS